MLFTSIYLNVSRIAIVHLKRFLSWYFGSGLWILYTIYLRYCYILYMGKMYILLRSYNIWSINALLHRSKNKVVECRSVVMCLKIRELLQISSIDSVCYPQLIRSIFIYMSLMLIALQLFTAVFFLRIEFHISKISLWSQRA